MRKREKMNYTISMKARDGSNAMLTQKEVNNPEEILGVWQAPINDGKKQMEVLKGKVVQWVKVFKEAKWAKTRAIQAVNTRIMKGIEYPLVATTLTASQCKNIQQPRTQAVKKHLGYKNKCPPK